ncbi:MAG: type 4a pilus biogenesis protein PilO [bacterium]
MNSRILPVLAIMVAVGIFFIYINPTWSGPIAATKTAITNDDQALEAASEYTAKQNELASARNAIDPADLERISIFLPDSVDNVGLILDLNTLASQNGLSLSNVDVTSNAASSGSAETGILPVSVTSPVNSADLSLSAIGTYSALQNFLRGVEKSVRILDVKDIVVKGSDTGVYTYQMKLRLYWLR